MGPGSAGAGCQGVSLPRLPLARSPCMLSAMEEDESPAFWAQKSPDELAAVAAEMHRQRRAWHGESLEREVQAARRAVGEMFLRGRGIEVGAGPRPFPIPKAATCDYGDIRDAQSLRIVLQQRRQSAVRRG